MTVFLLAAGFACPQAAPRGGYLPGSQMPDMIRIIPPPPTLGDSRDVGDRAIFKATRALEGSPRWRMAQSDNDFAVPGLMKAFSCSAGLTLDPQNAPRLSGALTRVLDDTTAAMNPAKDKYQVKRPFMLAEGSVCINPSSLSKSPDYPSGHTIFGWAVGSILAEIEPDRAAEIMARARAFGESRVVCGVHNASAVEAGRMIGTAMVAALHGSAVFRADMDAVRTEIAALRAKNPTAGLSCAAEAATLATSPY